MTQWRITFLCNKESGEWEDSVIVETLNAVTVPTFADIPVKYRTGDYEVRLVLSIENLDKY